MNKFEEMREQLKNGGVKVVSAPQLFPTPKAVIDLMIEHADLWSSHFTLEPSAGTGAIADAIKPLVLDVACCELNHDLAQGLRGKGYRTIHGDFMDYIPMEKFDRILMNPPFSKGQDIDHVQHAFENCLETGGRLVAVMCSGPFFRSDRKSTAFREWLEKHDHQLINLPQDSFKQSGTGVNTKLIIMDK